MTEFQYDTLPVKRLPDSCNISKTSFETGLFFPLYLARKKTHLFSTVCNIIQSRAYRYSFIDGDFKGSIGYKR